MSSNEWLDEHIDDEVRYMQGKSKLTPELALQSAIMDWLETKYFEAWVMTTASCGGLPTSPKHASFNKAAGYKKGTFDLSTAIPKQGFHGLYIEVKPLKSGKPTPGQLEYGVLYRSYGYCARIERGWKNITTAFNEYLTESVPWDYADHQPLPKEETSQNSHDEPTHYLPGQKPGALTPREQRIQQAIFRGIKNAKITAASKQQWRKR